MERKKPLPVQVCYELADPDTYQREIVSLVYCCKKLKVNSGSGYQYDQPRTQASGWSKSKIRGCHGVCLGKQSV